MCQRQGSFVEFKNQKHVLVFIKQIVCKKQKYVKFDEKFKLIDFAPSDCIFFKSNFDFCLEKNNHHEILQ